MNTQWDNIFSYDTTSPYCTYTPNQYLALAKSLPPIEQSSLLWPDLALRLQPLGFIINYYKGAHKAIYDLLRYDAEMATPRGLPIIKSRFVLMYLMEPQYLPAFLNWSAAI